MNRSGILLLGLAGAFALPGCTVGPDFRAPDPPAVERYVPAPPPAAPGLPRLQVDRDLPADWWSAFGSPAIDTLIRRALAGNPSLDEARARLRQAEELRQARAGGSAWPQVDLTAGAARQAVDPSVFGFPQAPIPAPFNLFSLGASASYDFDLAGGTQRELEALAADVDYQRYELEGARLTLATNVVASALRRAALAVQVDIAEALVAAQRSELGITEGRFADGGVAWVDVQNRRSELAQAEATLAPLRGQWAQAGHQLAVLLGEPPATAELPTLRLTDIILPAELPLRLPSELVRQRPDIRASEALLHKASANVGVATAALYPRLVISGSMTPTQLSLSDLFGGGINVWSFGANLLQPLFRGGELKARQRAAEAAFDQAAASYRRTVLLGLQNVADVLRALEADSAALAARSEQLARTEDALRVTAARHELGGVSQAAVWVAERQRLTAESARAEARARQLQDAAALFQALGGSWQAPALGGSRQAPALAGERGPG